MRGSTTGKDGVFKSSYDHIFENSFKTILIALLFPVFLFAFLFIAVFLFASTMSDGNTLKLTIELMTGISPVFALCVIGWMAIAYWTGPRMLLKSARALPITKEENPQIYRLVENLCISTGIPLPKIYIMKDDSLNAFATGRNPKSASIALTTGIIKKLEKSELEGVIAHELAHIKNRDIRLMVLIIAVIGFSAFAAELLIRMGFRSKKGGFPIIIAGLLFLAFSIFIAPLIRMAVSRRREYQADATAVLITRNPEALAGALEKISHDSRVESLDSRPSMALMCIENPLEGTKKTLASRFWGLWATHPPIADRVLALRSMNFGL